MGGTEDTGVDELGPVDYLVVEFPPGAQNFNGEMAAELVRLSDAGTIRVLDLLILQKAADGSIDAYEIDETDADETVAANELRALEKDLAEILAADDIDGFGGGDGARQRRRSVGLGEHLGRAVRQRRTPIRRPADREWPDPDPGDRRIDSSRTCRRGRKLTCHFDPPALAAAASSAVRSLAPPPSWEPRPWSPTGSADVTTAAMTGETTEETDEKTGATAAERGLASAERATRRWPESRGSCYLSRRWSGMVVCRSGCSSSAVNTSGPGAAAGAQGHPSTGYGEHLCEWRFGQRSSESDQSFVTAVQAASAWRCRSDRSR